MTEIHFNKIVHTITNKPLHTNDIKELIHRQYNLYQSEFYLLANGRRLQDGFVDDQRVSVILRLNGGKGGFGSMLRAIGAQIEKTTNREACRDLSGRRLRDINEEKRLKNWMETRGDREREATEKRQKKIERLCQQPKHKFEDTNYEQLRSELPDRVHEAVEAGMAASATSITAPKRRSNEKINKGKNKKKPKLWLDADLEDLDSSECDTSDDEKDKNDSGDNSKTNSEISTNENSPVAVNNESEATEASEIVASLPVACQ